MDISLHEGQTQAKVLVISNLNDSNQCARFLKSPAVADVLVDFSFFENPFYCQNVGPGLHVCLFARVSNIPACFHSTEGGLL